VHSESVPVFETRTIVVFVAADFDGDIGTV